MINWFLCKRIAKVIVAESVFIMLTVTFDLDVLSLVAGLGIGGLAIALAAKRLLKIYSVHFYNFSRQTFYSWRPGKGQGIEGMVESIGFRSTRIRALDKMMVTVPNKKW